jgi:hypothetical protein
MAKSPSKVIHGFSFGKVKTMNSINSPKKRRLMLFEQIEREEAQKENVR